jgi:hypothetical protein
MNETINQDVIDNLTGEYHKDCNMLMTEINGLRIKLTKILQEERDRCAMICEGLRPFGGRAWTEGQFACYEALTTASAVIRNGDILHTIDNSKIEIDRK